MGNIYLILIFFLINLPSIFTKANDTYTECEQIATKFNSNKTMNCYALENKTCPGNFLNNTCTFQHRVSASCINGTSVQIHIKSNGLPSFCPNRHDLGTFKEQNIDFTVNFNPEVSVNHPIHNSTTHAELNAIVCDSNSTKSAPAIANFTNHNDSVNFDRVIGISVDGVLINNILNQNQDIFYPHTTSSAESLDQCLGRTDTNGAYHYRIGSSCPIDSPDFEATTCKNIPTCHASATNYSVSMFINHRTLTVIGIAKDGHIIYGPYTSDGNIVTNGFDICNGMFFDSIGNYGYFVTSTFPYIIGCFGPGDYPKDILPNCTTNPPIHYKKSIYAERLTTPSSESSIVTFNFVFLSMTFIILINKYY